jgi:DnaJ family protein C protein 9
LKSAYVETGGSIEEILNHIPHSTHEDEPRFIKVISQLIESGDLPKLPTWESSIGDEKARLVRKKQSEKEAAEAEELAKELGVWDEFYGSGKPGKRKGKAAAASKDDEEDHSALQALILSKRKKMDGFLDNLAEKYAEPKSASKQKGKKRGAADAGGSSKKSKVEEPPEIDDAEFEKLQQKLFGDKEKSTQAKPTRKSSRTQRSK